MSWLSNILTPGGTSAYNTEQQNQANAAAQGMGLLTQLYAPLLAANQNTINLEPFRQQAIQNALLQSSYGNQLNQEKAYANNAFSNASRAAAGATAQNTMAGFSPGFSAGNNTAIMNNAANASNAYNAQVSSPQYQLQNSMNQLQLYGQAQSNPYASLYGAGVSQVYGQPKVQVQPGIGGALGSIVGSVLGGPLGGALGGLLGGGGSSSPFNDAVNNGQLSQDENGFWGASSALNDEGTFL